MRFLEPLAKLCAILAGVLLTVITLMTCASLIGRNTTGASLVGDFELTGVATAAGTEGSQVNALKGINDLVPLGKVQENRMREAVGVVALSR